MTSSSTRPTRRQLAIAFALIALACTIAGIGTFFILRNKRSMPPNDGSPPALPLAPPAGELPSDGGR